MRSSSTHTLLLLAATLLFAGVARAQPCVADPEDPWYATDMGELPPGTTGCQTCAPDNSTCVECWQKFGLSSAGTCVQCNVTSDFGSFSYDCDGDDPSFATNCISECRKGWCTGLYATAEGNCEQCPDENAAHCTSLNGTTIDCNPSSTLIGGTCESCSDDNCKDCTGDVKTCVECLPGYKLDNKGKCVEEKA